MNQHGKVYLVGAGPGRTEYLTVQAQQRLAIAEVLIYDALVDEALLSLVPDGCLTVDVGKRGGRQSTPQAEINRLLVDYCLQGKRVVRLKSGDPFIFGRCTAEIGALRDRHCDFEVVPGLSSALAAPLLAHIPLTDPVLSRCFAVVSAHEPDALNWEALSLLDTVVILMGGRQIEEIVHQLGKHGRSPQTPVAVIRWGGHPNQQVWTGTLATILHETAHQSLSPAVIVVGDVVRLRPYLEGNAPIDPPIDPPTDAEDSHPLKVPPDLLPDLPPDLPPASKTRAPLAGKTVLVTRAAGQTGQFTALLKAQGAGVVEMPVLEIGPPSSWAALDGAIADLSRFDWLILTSTNGVEYFFERLLATGRDARALAGLKIAVVGQKTAQVLQQHGIQADFIPPNFVADSLVETFPVSPMAGLNILFPRVETGGREVLVKEFTAKGAVVTEVAAYQSGCASAIAPAALAALQQGTIDVITFASSKTVQCFWQLIHPLDQAIAPAGIDLEINPGIDLSRPRIASIGPQTSAACQTLIGRVDLEAEEYTLEGLTQALLEWATDESTQPQAPVS